MVLAFLHADRSAMSSWLPPQWSSSGAILPHSPRSDQVTCGTLGLAVLEIVHRLTKDFGMCHVLPWLSTLCDGRLAGTWKKAKHHTHHAPDQPWTRINTTNLRARLDFPMSSPTPESCQGTLEATLSFPSSFCWQNGAGIGHFCNKQGFATENMLTESQMWWRQKKNMSEIMRLLRSQLYHQLQRSALKLKQIHNQSLRNLEALTKERNQRLRLSTERGNRRTKERHQWWWHCSRKETCNYGILWSRYFWKWNRLYF